ncbi:MAG: pyridoxal 5'-phosphate synthase glutaminase subunit PdxT [Spirochaetota bacterium]
MVATAPIGVLAFQGDFAKHLDLLTDMGLEAVAVRTVEDLGAVSGLVIPGGESTTIGMLMERFDLLPAVRQRALDGMPVLGTCAGAILLARDIVGSDQPRLGLMDFSIHRNAYGRQIESFEADVRVENTGRGGHDDPSRAAIRAVFIRAPVISGIGSGVEVLASFEGTPVVVRQGNMLAATFHPELSGEPALHKLLFHNR